MNPKQRQFLIIIAVVIVAAVAFMAVIALANRPAGPTIDYASIPQSRTEDGAYVLGNADAPVTIVEFADWACSHCQVYRDTMDTFINEQVTTGRAKFEFRIFPTAGGQLTVYAGQIADCAEEQRPGAFWELQPILYELATTGRYTEDLGREVANRLGLDYSQLLSCSSSSTRVTDDVTFGRNGGVQGTPAVMVRNNDGEATFITYNGTTYNRSEVPLSVLVGVVDLAHAGA